MKHQTHKQKYCIQIHAKTHQKILKLNTPKQGSKSKKKVKTARYPPSNIKLTSNKIKHHWSHVYIIHHAQFMHKTIHMRSNEPPSIQTEVLHSNPYQNKSKNSQIKYT